MAAASGWWEEEFVTLQSVPSPRAFGDIGVAPSELAVRLESVPASRAFGTPYIVGPPQPVQLTGVPSPREFGTPTVSPGPVSISLTGIPSPRGFGTPTVTPGAATISLSSISSPRGYGTLSVVQNPEFRAIGAGSRGLAFTLTDTLNITSDDKILVAWYTTMIQVFPRPAMTCTLSGGQSLTEAGTILFWTDGSYRLWLTCFYLLNPAAGTGRVVTASTGGVSGPFSTLQAETFKNVSSVGTLLTNSGTSNAPTHTITGASNRLYAQAFAAHLGAGGNIVSYNRSQRGYLNNAGSNMPQMIGDGAGVGSFSFTAGLRDASSNPVSDGWGSAVLPLIP